MFKPKEVHEKDLKSNIAVTYKYRIHNTRECRNERQTRREDEKSSEPSDILSKDTLTQLPDEFEERI